MIVSCTGHRPDKLGGYGPAAQAHVYQIAYDWLETFRPSELCSGMALGWDQACAEAAIVLGIPLVAIVPFAGQEARWPAPSQEHYRLLLAHATRVWQVSTGGYDSVKMLIRNQRLVERGDLLLAMFDGTPGGTQHAVNYAKGLRKPIINLVTKL
jgi:uncharacterized phage-like protein YoqJ